MYKESKAFKPSQALGALIALKTSSFSHLFIKIQKLHGLPGHENNKHL